MRLPSLCLTCGYGEVKDEAEFDAHDCIVFRDATKAERDANDRAHWQETKRRALVGRWNDDDRDG